MKPKPNKAGQIAASYARQREAKRRAPVESRPFDVRVSAPVGIPTRDVVVDDPLQVGGKLLVTQSMRDDPLGRLHDRKQIDSAQYHAGRKMQAYYERSEIGNVKAMDTTKEPVDGGGIPEVLTEGQQVARKMVMQLELALGKNGAALIRDFLAHRLFVNQIAQKRGLSSEADLKFLGRCIRDCLECLAKELHFA